MHSALAGYYTQRPARSAPSQLSHASAALAIGTAAAAPPADIVFEKLGRSWDLIWRKIGISRHR